jgi:hypothetical protein
MADRIQGQIKGSYSDKIEAKRFRGTIQGEFRGAMDGVFKGTAELRESPEGHQRFNGKRQLQGRIEGSFDGEFEGQFRGAVDGRLIGDIDGVIG